MAGLGFTPRIVITPHSTAIGARLELWPLTGDTLSDMLGVLERRGARLIGTDEGGYNPKHVVGIGGRAWRCEPLCDSTHLYTTYAGSDVAGMSAAFDDLPLNTMAVWTNGTYRKPVIECYLGTDYLGNISLLNLRHQVEGDRAGRSVRLMIQRAVVEQGQCWT